jgi:hypothetical protein
MAFLSDINAHLDAFAAASNVSRENVRVRLTLADGSSVVVHGLQTVDAPSANGWGLIRGLVSADSQTQALSVREGHVVKAEFQLPSESKSIGFQAEAG